MWTMKRSIALLLFSGLLMTAPAQDKVISEELFNMGTELGVGARAIGLGGAFTGIADDYSAIYWNPAGLGQMRRMEMNIGFSHNSFNADADFLGGINSSKDTFTRLNSLGFVFPIPTYQGSLVFGVGYQKVRDYNQSLDMGGLVLDPNGTAFPWYVVPTYDNYTVNPPEIWTTDVSDSLFQSKSVLDDGSANMFSLSGAMEVQENFFLGATMNFISGKINRSFEFKEEDIYDLYNYFDEAALNMSDLKNWIYTQDIESNIDATNFKLGLFYRSEKNWRFGASMTTPTTYKISESWSWKQTEYYDGATDAAILEDAGKQEYKYQEPYSFNVGGSARLLNVLVSGDLEFKDWTQAKFKSDGPIEGMYESVLNRAIKKEMQSTTKLRAGAEIYVTPIGMRLRGGYFFDPSPYVDTAIRPDRTWISAGASMMLDKQVMLDLTYVHGSWEDKSTDNLSAESSLVDRSLNKIIGTVSLRF